MQNESGAYIELRGITKSFGGVLANDGIDLTVSKGEIHALLGENGSGKSTLVNMLAGIYSPDAGEILLEGRNLRISSPKDAILAGIGMVHQHFKLVDVLTARENILVGRPGGFFIEGKKLSAQIKGIAGKYGLEIDPEKKVYNMSVGEKQTVEILKVLYRGANLLILDEPTAVLTPQEIKSLFDILRNMKAAGCAIIIITHKINEVMEISDRITVLRRGKSIQTVDTDKTTPRELTEMMVGRPISLEIERTQADESLKTPLLEVENLTVVSPDGVKRLNEVSFTMTGGEILGIAGIAGSGQKELCEAIVGLQKATAGSVLFSGGEILGMSPRDIIKKGVSMSFIPEDRLGMGLVAGMDITDNVLLKAYQNMPGIFINREIGKKMSEDIIGKFDISTLGVNQPVKNLSGGNIQKVLLGREIELSPHLLIAGYPVRGLDIGASYSVYDVLNEQKKKGVGIIYVGEDLDVLLELCDRILVLSRGEIVDIVDAAGVTKEEIGLMMFGQQVGRKGGSDV